MKASMAISLAVIYLFHFVYIAAFSVERPQSILKSSSSTLPYSVYFRRKLKNSRDISPRSRLRSTTENEQVEMVTVRFINTVSGKDVVTTVPAGYNLLVAGDEAGVKLPRACRTGLCGSCTCEVKDPAAIVTSSNPRAGFATIRACSAKCFVPSGYIFRPR